MEFIKSYSSAKAAKVQATKLAGKTGLKYTVVPNGEMFGIVAVETFKPMPVVENKKGVIYVDGTKLGNYFPFGPVDEEVRDSAVAKYVAYTGNEAMRALIQDGDMQAVEAVKKAKTCWGAIEAVKKLAESAFA